MKGINLGGWFVLEGWMNRPLFKQVRETCKDETCFTLESPDSKKALLEHHSAWIKEEDITWLMHQGFDLVRIPVPWWFLGEGGYHRSVDILDEKLKMINDLGMDFMIDLHTAPGCQNGFDNGGIEGVLTWHLDQANIDKTTEICVALMKRYDHLEHFHSIELLNEPFVSIDLEIIYKFYIDTYRELRKINQKRLIVFHDAFRIHAWKDFFMSNDLVHVALDTHIYQCFSKEDHALDLEGHLTKAKQRFKIIDEIQSFIPLIVGEWSLGLHLNLDGLNEKDVLKSYYDAQLEGMKNAYATIFWSYKINSQTHAGWNFRQLIEKEIL